MNDLPSLITLRALAVELCPSGRPINSFKDELRRLLKAMGVRRSGSKHYALSDLMDQAPQLVSTWEEMRAKRSGS